MGIKIRNTGVGIVLIVLTGSILYLIQLLIPIRPNGAIWVGISKLRRSVFCFIGSSCPDSSWGIGKCVMVNKFTFDSFSRMGNKLIGVTLGLGCIAYIVFFLGLFGLLQPFFLILLLILIGVLTWRECVSLIKDLVETTNHFKQIWQSFRIIEKILLIIGGMALFLAFIGNQPLPGIMMDYLITCLVPASSSKMHGFCLIIITGLPFTHLPGKCCTPWAWD